MSDRRISSLLTALGAHLGLRKPAPGSVPVNANQPDPDVLAEAAVQAQRLELAERDRTIAHLKQTLEQQRASAGARLHDSVQMEIEKLLAEAAAPAAQLLTQAHLLEIDQKPIQARDVLLVAGRLVRVLQDHGLQPLGAVGDTVSFDPNQHEPLQAGEQLSPGKPVTVRVPAMTYHGKILRKAGVTG